MSWAVPVIIKIKLSASSDEFPTSKVRNHTISIAKSLDLLSPVRIQGCANGESLREEGRQSRPAALAASQHNGGDVGSRRCTCTWRTRAWRSLEQARISRHSHLHCTELASALYLHLHCTHICTTALHLQLYCTRIRSALASTLHSYLVMQNMIVPCTA